MKNTKNSELRFYRMMLAAHYPPAELAQKTWSRFWIEITAANAYEQSPISKSVCKVAFELQKKAAIKYMEGR